MTTRRAPTPYEPSPAELAALGARLFGLEEHEPRARTSCVSDLSDKSQYKEVTNAKN